MAYWYLGCTIVDLSQATKEWWIEKINRVYDRDIKKTMFDRATRIQWGQRKHHKTMEKIDFVDGSTEHGMKAVIMNDAKKGWDFRSADKSRSEKNRMKGAAHFDFRLA